MTYRQTAIAAALVAIALTFAQDVRPGLDFYHTWQYAVVLTLVMIPIVTYGMSARKGRDGAIGRRLAIAMLGAFAIATGGLLSGLIGPDTLTVSGSPGTVTPVPDLRAAVFFGQADPQTIARGDVSVTLRERGAAPKSIPSRGQLTNGTAILYLRSRPAAYVEARDLHGNRLTVTQPTGSAFLSPVLTFPQMQPLGTTSYPLDTFAMPALHRVARALYFRPEDAQKFSHLSGKDPALVLSLNDDGGKTIGLAVAPSGTEVRVGDVRVTATLGTYPQLLVASAPHPALLIVGGILFLAGLGAAFGATMIPNRATRLRTGSDSA